MQFQPEMEILTLQCTFFKLVPALNPQSNFTRLRSGTFTVRNADMPELNSHNLVARFGYAVTQDPFLSDALKQGVLSHPHQTLRYAAKKILAARVNADEPMTSQLAQQRRLLQVSFSSLAAERKWGSQFDRLNFYLSLSALRTRIKQLSTGRWC